MYYNNSKGELFIQTDNKTIINTYKQCYELKMFVVYNNILKKCNFSIQQIFNFFFLIAKLYYLKKIHNLAVIQGPRPRTLTINFSSFSRKFHITNKIQIHGYNKYNIKTFDRIFSCLQIKFCNYKLHFYFDEISNIEIHK